MEATSSGGLRMTSDLARDLYSLKMNNGLPLGLEHHVSQANTHPGNDSVDYRPDFDMTPQLHYVLIQITSFDPT